MVSSEDNVHHRGLARLAALFAEFDTTLQFSGFSSQSSLLGGESEQMESYTSTNTRAKSPVLSLDRAGQVIDSDIIQTADYLFTKQWMCIVLWQKALLSGYLSSNSTIPTTSFSFPATVARDLLASIISYGLSTEKLVSLGRDQVLKSFEIINALADVVLCASRTARLPSSPSHSEHASEWNEKVDPRTSKSSTMRFSARDFLHELYTFLSPMIALHPEFDSLLQRKISRSLSDLQINFASHSFGSLIRRGDDVAVVHTRHDRSTSQRDFRPSTKIRYV